jgi:hypothetical protein
VKVEDLWKKSQQEKSSHEVERPYVMPNQIIPRPRVTYQKNVHHNRGDAVIHSLEEEEIQEDNTTTLAMVDTPARSDLDNSFYSALDDRDYDDDELYAMTPEAAKDPSKMPCYDEYKGACKLGPACPYFKSHGDRTIMEERTRRLAKQILESKYGGSKLLREIIIEYQAKQNNLPSTTTQDHRHQAATPRQHQSNEYSSPGTIQRNPAPLQLSNSRERLIQASTPMASEQGRGGNYQGRGGGRLVTFSGRGNMGRAQYTNHLILGDNQEQHIEDEVQEVEQDLSC